MSRPVSTENAFRALAHATRRRVVELLHERSRTAGELAEHFNHSRPVLSKHLRILEGVGFIASKRRGTAIEYRLQAKLLGSLHRWIVKVATASTAAAR